MGPNRHQSKVFGCRSETNICSFRTDSFPFYVCTCQGKSFQRLEDFLFKKSHDRAMAAGSMVKLAGCIAESNLSWVVLNRCQFVQLMLENRTTIWQYVPSTFWDILDYLWTLVMHISPSPSPPNLLTRCCRLCHLKTCHGSLHHVLIREVRTLTTRGKTQSLVHMKPKGPNPDWGTFRVSHNFPGCIGMPVCRLSVLLILKHFEIN